MVNVFLSVESNIEKKLMTKALLNRVDAEIKRRRSEVTKLQEELEDLDDYLEILEARRRAVGKRTYSQAEMEKRYKVK